MLAEFIIIQIPGASNDGIDSKSKRRNLSNCKKKFGDGPGGYNLFAITQIASFTFAIYAIVAGAWYLDDDKFCKHDIAMWLLIYGSVGLGGNVGYLLFVACMMSDNYKGLGLRIFPCFACLFGLFLFAWWITGNVWIFTSSTNNCPENLFHSGFWYLIAGYIYGGVFSCLQCCIGVAAAEP